MSKKGDFNLVENRLSSMASPGIKPGLARLAKLLHEAGRPQERFPAVHVVGTNGKGSTAAGISSILKESGYKTALYTSPHLVSFAERLQVDRLEVSANEWLRAADDIERIIKTNTFFDNNLPTYFEIVTAAAIMITAHCGVDVAVFEAGMGGRLDATNILKDIILSVIVPIGMDHTEFLGTTLQEIAAEKFAVLRCGVPALFCGDAKLNEQFVKTACQHRAKSHVFSDEYFISNRLCTFDGSRFTLCCGKYSYEYHTPLVGTFQAENAAMAVSAAKLLMERFPMISEKSIERGISETLWPGRMEKVSDAPPVILDGGHNPHAMQRLAETLLKLFGYGRVNIVLAMMRDKDIAGAIGFLKLLNAFVYCTCVPDNERSLKAEDMDALVCAAGLRSAGVYGEPLDAVRAAIAEGSPTICCGSLFLVGYLKENYDRI